jgi:hypothetical protein
LGRKRGISMGSGGENMIKVYHLHVWKCHNETHCFKQLIYTNKKMKEIQADNQQPEF